MAGKKRRSEESSSSKITIKILGHADGYMVHFRVKRDTPLRKLLLKYCESKHLEYSAMVFLYNGERVLVRRTPDELNMKDEDQIDAMFHTNGGGFQCISCNMEW